MEGCTYICAYYTYLYMYNIFTWNFFCHWFFWCSTVSIHRKYNAQVHFRLNSHQLPEHIASIFSALEQAIIWGFGRNWTSKHFRKLFSDQNIRHLYETEISLSTQTKTIISNKVKILIPQIKLCVHCSIYKVTTSRVVPDSLMKHEVLYPVTECWFFQGLW